MLEKIVFKIYTVYTGGSKIQEKEHVNFRCLISLFALDYVLLVEGKGQEMKY
jgi:hypothetical protein